MATDFPIETYPISNRTRVLNSVPSEIDSLNDGSYRFRILNTDSFGDINVVFVDQTPSIGQQLIDYLISNAGEEFNLPILSAVYTGIFKVKAINTDFEGYPWRISVDFRGRRTT